MAGRGRIRAADIALVRERSKIDEIVGEHLQLKRAGGGSLKGLCPFHDEKSPSFQVTPTRNLFHCFGCGEGGDVISFVQKIDHLSFSEAVELLAGRAGVELHYEDDGGRATGGPDRAQVGQRARLVAANTAAAAFFAEQLGTPDAAPARQFLAERGFDRQVAARLRLRLRPRRLGRADPAPARQGLHPGRAGHRGAGEGVLARHADRPVPPAAGLADPRHHRRRHRLRRPQADGRRPGPEVPQHPRDAALQEEHRALRHRAGQARHRQAAPGGRRRGLHRRHGLPPRRRHHRRRLLRHGVRRRAHQRAAPAADGPGRVPRRGRLHLRRRRSGPGRRDEDVRGGPALRRRRRSSRSSPTAATRASCGRSTGTPPSAT